MRYRIFAHQHAGLSEKRAKTGEFGIFEKLKILQEIVQQLFSTENFVGGIFEGRDLNLANSEFEPQIQPVLHAEDVLTDTVILSS